jgi:hypothetical protein
MVEFSIIFDNTKVMFSIAADLDLVGQRGALLAPEQ